MRKICLFIILVLDQSCLAGRSDYYRDHISPFLKELKPSYKPKVFDGVMEPIEFPDLEEDQKTLIGIDSNHDGVRDDLEIYINRNFNHFVERENLKNEIKRATDYYTNYKKMSVDEFIVFESNSTIDIRCIWFGLKSLSLKASPEMLKYRSTEVIFNSRERSATYNYFSEKLNGRAFGDGYGDKKIFTACKKRIEEELNLKNEGKL